MALTGEQAYALSKKTIQDITQGITMIEGKPCTIASITEITGGHRVTYRWTANNGTTKTQTMDVMDGVQGPQGVKGDTGNTGATGAQGPAGADGTSATIRVGNVTSGATPTITNSGTNLNAVFDFVLPKGDKGDKGDKGEDGQNGSSFSIRSRFATEEELIAAYPDGPENPGDAYFVGTTASPDLYVWLIDAEEWHNNGPIAGVKGDKGDQGDEGFSPVANVTKDGGVATITIRDKTGTTTQQISDGTNGNDGQDGADGKSAYDIAVDEGFVGTKAEWLASLKGETGAAGANGTNGTDGVSPVANVTKTDDVIKIHIEDSTGTTEEEIDMSDYAKQIDVDNIQELIPSDASASNKLVTRAQSGAILPLVNLGTEYTAELKADISSGKFEKAVVGGYLTINGHVYYFAHPDYWLHTGDTECTTHHMLVIPADNIGTGKMNNSNITTGGYAGSDIKTGNNSNTALAVARAQIIADFGAANILTHRELFTTAVTDGKASNWEWADSDVDLMNEVMVYGCNAWGSHPGYETGIDKCQLKLFQERPDLITTRSNWWLRGVVSAAHFALVSGNGNATNYGASYALGVRPAFAIIGD